MQSSPNLSSKPAFAPDIIAAASIPVTDAVWDAWLAAQPQGQVLQLSGWRRLKQRFGWQGRLVATRDAAGRVHGGAQVLLQRRAGITLAYVPRGPITDWHDGPATAALLQAIKAESRAAGAAVLKIEPDLADTPANRSLLAGYGFSPSAQTVQPPSTIVVDLGGSDEAVLGRMKSKWRYNIRLAERKEVQVRPLSRAELPRFDALMAATGQRDGFAVHSPAYYAAAYDLLVPDHAVFLLAEYAGEPLAAIVVAAVGDTAWYLWGASSDRERSRMPNHALQWAGMRWARARGATRYDLWGIPDDLGRLALALRGGDGSGTPVDDLPVDLEALPPGDLWGVYRFKQGFGGQVVRAVGAWDMPVDPLGFRVYQLGVGARQWLDGFDPAHRLGGNGGTSLAAPKAAPVTALTSVVTPAEWRRVLAGLPEPHVLQSWEWGEVKAQTGWHAERLAVESAFGPAAFQFLWRQPIDHVPLRVAYVPKGPALDWTNLDLADATLAAVEAHARARGCLFVKVDPDVRDDDTAGRLVLHALERRGWLFSADQVQFKNTGLTDLSGGEEALLAQMKQKWRYNVRLAEKRGVTVRLGGLGDLEGDLRAFYDLYAETGARDGFLIRPFGYYDATWRTFLHADDDAANPAGGALLLAEHPDDPAPVAGLFLMRYGARAWYFYGASSERHRRDMPNYLLQWEAMRWARAQGCTVYDWWGAPTHPDDPADPMQGVWQFKQGFGAQFTPHIGAWDYPVSPLLYRAYVEGMPFVLDWMRGNHRP